MAGGHEPAKAQNTRSVACAAAGPETPPRIKWVCRQVGADKGFVCLDLLGYGKPKLGALHDGAVI